MLEKEMDYGIEEDRENEYKYTKKDENLEKIK